MNNQRSFYKLLVISILVLLIIGIAGFYWFFAKRSGGLLAPRLQPHAAVFLAKQSPVMVALLLNPDQLEVLDRTGAISQIKTSLFAKTNVDYRQDIQPWLSNEITLAVTSIDIDHNPENGLQPGYLMALATKNQEQSRGFVEYLFSERAFSGAKLVVEQYKGVKIISDSNTTLLDTSNPNSTTEFTNLASAVVKNFVLFANDSKAIKEAINNLQAPNLDLASSSEYKSAILNLPNKAVSMAFFNLPAVAQWQRWQLSQPVYHSQITSLVLQPQGVLAESTFLTKSEITHSKLLSQPIATLKYIPASAGLVVTGDGLQNLNSSDLGKLWQQGSVAFYGSQADANTKLPGFLTEISHGLGLNLSNDIFSWVTGEYTIAILDSAAQENPHWILITEKSPELADGIAKLDAIARKNGFNVSYFDFDQHQVSAWTRVKTVNEQDKAPVAVDTKIFGVHTSVDNLEIFTSDLQTLNQILTDRQNGISNNPSFQKQLAQLPQPNQGFVYIDWEKSQKILEEQLPLLKYLEVLGKPIFENLQAVTISNYGQESGLLKLGIFLQMP